MKYVMLFVGLCATIWGGTPGKVRFFHRFEKPFMPEYAYLDIVGFRERLVRDTVNSDYTWAYFDSAGNPLNAGDAFLDNQQIPWDNGQYWLEYSQGFRYQASHPYAFRVTGSANVPCCTVRVTSAGPNVSVTTPAPDDTVIKSQGLRVAWQPRGDTVYIQLSDTVNSLYWQIVDTGSVFFAPATLESLLTGQIWLYVWRESYSEEYPGFPFTIWTTMCEMFTLELAGVSVEEPVNPYLRNRGPLISVKPQPARSRLEICLDSKENGRIKLDVFDASGRWLTCLFETRIGCGQQRIQWDLKDAQGRALAPGVYFLRLKASAAAVTKKVVVLE